MPRGFRYASDQKNFQGTDRKEERCSARGIIRQLWVPFPLGGGEEFSFLRVACPWNNYKFLQVLFRPRDNIPEAWRICC